MAGGPACAGLSAAGPARGRDRGQEQALARAVEHQDFGRRIDRARQLEAAAEPGGGGVAEGVEALVHRIAAELGDMGGQHRANERRDGVLRLAHRQADGGLAGLGMSPNSSRSRTNGERPTSARTGEGGGTRSAAVMNMD